MITPSIYINLDDDISKIVQRIRREKSSSLILVCPKRCLLFSDSINLKLLKEQTDALTKEVFVLTMDERGQTYAQEAGFQLKFLPKRSTSNVVSDIRTTRKVPVEESSPREEPSSVVENEPVQIQEPVVSPPVQKVYAPPVAYKSENITTQASPTIVDIKVDDIPSQKPAPSKIKKAKKPRVGKLVFALLGVSLILIGALVFVVLPKATVIVYPRKEPLTRDFLEISLSPNVKEIDYARLSLPGEKVEATIQSEDKFQSQGKKQVGNRASGSVKIYNFTKVPINLKAGTTSFMLGGKVYKLVADVSGLKPTTYKNASTKEVNEVSLGDSFQVIADLGGEDYNVPAGTRLEITNEVFGSQPQVLYAKTDSEVTGGTTRYLSIISADDQIQAEKTLQERSLKAFRDELTKQGKVLADKAFAIEVNQFNLSKPVGTETPSFQAGYSAKVTGMVFKGEDLKNLIFKRIEETLAQNKTLRPKNPDKTSYTVKSLDLNNQVVVMEAHFEGEAVYSVDLSGITPELTGKTQNEVYEILSSKAEIEKVEITLAPSWQKHFPYFSSQIKLNTFEE